jgi:predicted type IV restriction endonuclease
LYSYGHLSSRISSFCILVHCHKRFYQPLTVHTASVAAFFLYISTLEDRTDILSQNVTNILII